MNQHIRYHQMSIECQYMSNICQAQTKGEWDNETDKRIKREQEKGPRGASRSKGSKALSSRVRRFKDLEHHMISRDVTRQTKCLELEDSKIVRRLRKLFSCFMRGFPLQSPPPLEKHRLDAGGMKSRWNGMVPKVNAWICQGAPGCLV